MAAISLYSRTSSSLTVRLTGLDSNYNGTKRTVKWYVGSTLKKTTTINNGITTSPTVTLSGLSASTRYTVKCVISNIQGMSSGVTLTATYWTEDPTPTISSFTVTQTSTGTKTAKCSWRCSNLISGATYEITVSGWSKASGKASTSGSVNISLDSFKTYTATLTVYNNDKSASKSKTFTISDYDLTPTDIETTRIDGGFEFSWDGAYDAEYFKVRLTRNYDDYEHSKTVYSSSATFTGLQYGVAYTIEVRAYYSSSKYGSWTFGYTCTTSPAQPTFTASSKNGVITVNYNLAESSNVSYVYINLYDSTNSTVLQQKTLTSASGSFSYNKVADGKYYIRAQSVFVYSGSYLYCVDDYGTKYTLTKSITVSSKPASFSWTYAKNSGSAFNLKATEWNSFTSKINEFRDWKGLSDYSFTTAVKGNTFTAAMFNQAVTAINAMYSNNPLSSVSKGSTVTAYILNNIVSVLNNVPE